MDPSSQWTTVIASFWNRRDAEIAQDHLEKKGISAFVNADDAGGMHPELQLSQGVHLVVLGEEAQHAHEVLEQAGLLPQAEEDMEEGDLDEKGTMRGAIRVLLILFAVLTTIVLLSVLLTR